MTRVGTPIIFAALLAALAGCGPGAGADGGQGQAGGVARIGGPFALIDQNSRPVDQRVLAGKWTAVFFGYTYCPDVCPTTLTLLGRAQSMLGPRARNLRVVFISVDPGRDTPAQLKAYLASPVFPTGTLGLTGSDAQIAQAAKAYKVFYQKQGSGEGYTVDHTSAIYLMDPRGKFDRVLAESLTPDQITHQISEAMDQGPNAGA